MNTRKIGAEYEALALTYLLEHGYVILACNYRCRIGEIDIIAQDDQYLVFLEVKYRKNKESGGALSAVGYKKQRIISKVAGYYMLENQILDNVPCRFDVIAIEAMEVNLIKNAFEYIE